MRLASSRWSEMEKAALVRMAAENKPAKQIARHIGRSAQAVQSFAERNGISIGGYWSKRKN